MVSPEFRAATLVLVGGAVDGPLPIGEILGGVAAGGLILYYWISHADFDSPDPTPPPALRRPKPECEAQYEADLEICRGLPTDRQKSACYGHAMVRRNLCEEGHPVPPLSW